VHQRIICNSDNYTVSITLKLQTVVVGVRSGPPGTSGGILVAREVALVERLT